MDNNKPQSKDPEKRLPEGVRYPNVYLPSFGIQIVSIMVLVGAAAVGYLADFFFMVILNSGGLKHALDALFCMLPLLCIVVYIQEFAFKIRQGKVTFFRNQTAGQLFANSLFILAIACFFALITQRVVQLNGSVEPSLMGFLILMAVSFGFSGLLRYFRKHPLME